MLTGHVETSPSNLNVSRGEWTRETDSNRRESKINSVSLVARESLTFFLPSKKYYDLSVHQEGKMEPDMHPKRKGIKVQSMSF